MSARVLLAAAAASLGASCITGDYNQARIYRPTPYDSFDDLIVGVTNVDHAMSALGAPLQVIEVGRGMALAWGWQESGDWNVAGTFPIGDVSGRVTYADASLEIPGIVLFFDSSWRLVSKHEGYLAELLRERQLPRDVDDDLIDDPPEGPGVEPRDGEQGP